MITSAQIAAVASMLEGKQNIVIFTHQSPDGDAMGSSLGLYHYLRSLGKQATIIVPNRFPAFLSWMPGADSIVVYADEMENISQSSILSSHFPEGADLAFCLDFNEPKRIGDASALLEALQCPKILVDHHIGPDASMVDLVISYPAAPAASYLVLELINGLNDLSYQSPKQTNKQKILQENLATCLYTGLMTDTGNFAFNSNNAELYQMIAQLISSGINKDKIYDSVFNQFSTERLRFTGYCLYHKMRIFPKHHTALIAISSDELRRFNFQSGDAEGIVNMPLQIANVYYSCFMREDVDKIKVSFRSQGERPVNDFSHEYFNGGGHMNAAGGEFHGSLADAVKQFENNYAKHFKKY